LNSLIKTAAHYTVSMLDHHNTHCSQEISTETELSSR